MIPRIQTDELNPAHWFIFAMERLKCADSLWKDAGLTASGIELLQEGVERLLKGFLIANGWKLVRTHDLQELTKAAQYFNPGFSGFLQTAVILTEDFFDQHYPGGDLSNCGQEYEKNRAKVEELLGLIRSLLPQYLKELTPS